MRRWIAFVVAGAMLLAFVLAPASASALSAKLDYHIADAFIGASVGIPQTGARAEADNGDIVSVSGEGTFNLGSRKATGGGTFLHTDGDGDVLGFGTWTATNVVDFDFYGCATEFFPANFCGGVLTLGVRLVAAGGATELDGILRIDCLLGTDVPPGAVEGIMLFIPGVISFDETLAELSGLTLFVSRSKNG